MLSEKWQKDPYQHGQHVLTTGFRVFYFNKSLCNSPALYTHVMYELYCVWLSDGL